METRTPTPDDDVVSIDRWEGEGGARTSPAEEARHATLASVTDHDNVRAPPPPRRAVTRQTIDVSEAAVLSERFRNALSPSPQSVDQ